MADLDVTIKEVERLTLTPGDILVFHTEERLPQSAVALVLDRLKTALKADERGVDVLVIDGRSHLTALSVLQAQETIAKGQANDGQAPKRR